MRIGFYTSGNLPLPHPPYQKGVLLLIERAISEAWRILCDSPEGDFDVRTAKEDRITRDLKACLFNRILAHKKVNGFTQKVFRLSRESKFESYNGNHLDKMPDLHFDIVQDREVAIPSMDGLFVECKPVDTEHTAGAHYCDRGLIRFVKGEYAWAMSQGLMIGYASPGYVLPQKLASALNKRKTTLGADGDLTPCTAAPAGGYAQPAFMSVHAREFEFPMTKSKATSITIRHLWLNRGNASGKKK